MLKYDIFNQNPYATHMKIVQTIGDNNKVLEVGCSTGQISRRLYKKNCEIIGIELDENASKIASAYCKKLINEDVESIEYLPVPEKYFDYIICSDVLEHLKSPEKVLETLRKYLKDDGRIIVSLPNIAYWKIRFKLLKGSFDYEETGILDKTHLKFFTAKTSKDLLKRTGFEVTNFDIVPKALPYFSEGYLMKIKYKISKIFPNIFATQFIIIGKKIV